MGPRLLQRRRRETKYTLRLLPIGGYVAMEGEQGDSEDPGAFEAKPPWQKGIIILAGGVVNLLTGVLLMLIVLSSAKLIATPVVKVFDRGAVTQQQGLRAGDRITAVDSHRIYTSYDISYYMGTDADGIVTLTVDRAGEKVVLPDVKLDADRFDFQLKGVRPTFGTVSKYAWADSVSMARIVWDSLWKLISGQYGLSALSGPIGTIGLMANTSSQAAASSNWQTMLLLWALLAVNIGVFNLIPFPALDGGRFFFIVLEGIRRKPVSEQTQAAVNSFGMIFLIGLMVVVTISDIVKLT